VNAVKNPADAFNNPAVVTNHPANARGKFLFIRLDGHFIFGTSSKQSGFVRNNNQKPLPVSVMDAGSLVLRRSGGWIIRSAFRGAESARDPDDKAYHQNQTKPAAADGRTAQVKSAAA
jgi:hypothetical protein